MTKAAKRDDVIVATDTHIILVPGPTEPCPTPTPMPFSGKIDGGLSATVFIDDQPAAVDGSTATNSPAHTPTAGPFQTPPSDRGTIIASPGTVFIEGSLAAKDGDAATTCNDPADLPVGSVSVATSSVILDAG